MAMLRHVVAVLLLISIVGNVHLFMAARTWQQAWLAQFLTTSDIETVLKKSGADISFEALQKIAQREYKSSFEVLSPDAAHVEVGGSYDEVIVIGDTRLLFKNNKYAGSRANLPNHDAYRWVAF